jgi:hypothetical protein
LQRAAVKPIQELRAWPTAVPAYFILIETFLPKFGFGTCHVKHLLLKSD